MAVLKVTGVAFRLHMLSTGKWEETLLYMIGGAENYYTPAISGFDPRGNLYGTTNVGRGFGPLEGSVFRLEPPAGHGVWDASLLYEFSGGVDGGYPNANLTLSSGGALYGTTQGGGDGPACQFGCGTVFELAP